MADSDDHALLLQMSFDLNRLQKQTGQAQGILDKGLTTMEKRAKKAAASLEESLTLKGANFEGALAEVFSASRLKVLDTGAAKIGLFGGALETLGPIGLGAAAGIGAFSAAVENSLKTGEWALDLTHAAGALGLTTTQLQKFDFIASAAGIPVDKMRDSMAGLEKTIGNVESGLARSMSVKAFTDGLKIKPEDLRGWGDLEHQLPHIIEAASKLNAEERAGLAQRLKIDPEVLDSLIEYKDNLNDASDAADQFGVMSSGQVKKAADVEKQVKLTSAVIDSQFRMAFVNLAPAVVGAMGLVARFANGLVTLERNATLTGLAIAGMFKTFGGLTGDPFAGVKGYFANQRKADADADAESKAAAGPAPTQLSFPKGKKAHAAKSTDTTDAEDLDNADKLLAEAEKALATSIEARARFEQSELTAEAAKAQEKLAKDLKAAKTPADRAEVVKAQSETAQAYALKQELLARQTAQKLADQSNALAEIGLQGQVDMLDAERGLGGSLERRAEIALNLFDLDEQIQENKEQEVIASKTASDAEKALAAARLANLQRSAPERRQAVSNEGAQSIVDQQNDLAEIGLQGQQSALEADKAIAKTTEQRREIALRLFALDEQLQEMKLQEVLASKTATEAEKQKAQAELANLQATVSARAQAVSNSNPSNAWSAWLQDASASINDVGEDFAKMQVAGIDKFNQSLFTSQGAFRKFGDVARDVSREMITQFEQLAVKTAEVGLFGNGQPGTGLAGLLGGKGGGIGGMLGGLLGGKGNAPTGSASSPFYVQFAGGLGGVTGALGNSLGGALGNQGASVTSGGGGILGQMMTGIGHIFGFKDGGSFTVGGARGVDANLAVMKVTKGEKVSVTTPGQQAAWGAAGRQAPTQQFIFPNASIDGFKKSTRQLARTARMATSYGG